MRSETMRAVRRDMSEYLEVGFSVLAWVDAWLLYVHLISRSFDS
jgi:hypothetical protein